MNPTENLLVSCPYCMAENRLDIDTSSDLNQEFIQDCSLCCHPIEICVYEASGSIAVDLKRETD
ncbi:CPXCG motif-containing cysteine-rich protein [uncultured Neptuniibacter sp.]|uniref:CPXCG motif-containing cysteine-rich protein n=1 Tax=uncultured Neptuniibacter sp. TaxID=502143 RepID=UPI00261800FE|nr:CPXCG motif-containing cysteine-rich protein [uncultured Neptuniibacter sp.]